MKLIKAKEAPKVPKQKIKLPQIVTPENYHLAVMGLSLMLETDQDEFDLHRATSNVSSTSEHAVLILPVIDRIPGYLRAHTGEISGFIQHECRRLNRKYRNSSHELDSRLSHEFASVAFDARCERGQVGRI